MNARKIIFLDCDGVINSIQWEVARKDMPSGIVVDDAIDDIYDYIIIDDREDFLSEQIPLHLVHTNNGVGFSEKDKVKAIGMLSR